MIDLHCVRPRINELAYRVYSRSLHPELLEQHARRVIERDNYRFDVSITSAGHHLKFAYENLVLVEVATSSHHDLPKQCEIFSKKIRNTFEETIQLEQQIELNCSVSLETVQPKHLFSFNQIIAKADPANSLIHQFDPNGRIAMGAMSYLTIESRMNDIRVRAIHTFPDTFQILTSQSRFKIADQSS